MMKQFYFKGLFSLLLLLVGGVSVAWGDTYEKYSGTITEGDYVICDGSNAMKNVISSNKIGYQSVTVEDNKITNPNANIIWHIAADGEYWTIYNTSAKVYAAGSTTKNYGALITSITNYAKWTASGTSTYDFANKGRAEGSSNIGNKWLRYNSGYGFAPYASSTGNSLTLYKKVNTKTASDLAITNSTINLAIGGTTQADIAYTTSSDGTMHFTSNDTGIATVDSDGKVTAVAEGSTTITVSQDEGTSHQASDEKTVTINVSDVRTAAATITAISPASTINVGDMGTFTLTKTDNDGSGVTYTFESDDTSVLDVTSDGTYSGEKGGTANVTVIATPTNTASYKTVSVVFPFTVVNTNKTATVITLGEDAASVTFGDTYDLLVEATAGYEGTLTYVLSNPSIATMTAVDGGYTVTPTAVGTTTITFSAAETTNYAAAANAVFTLTVAEDATAPPLGDETIFSETLSNSGTNEGRLDNTGWYMSTASYIEQNNSNWAFRISSSNNGGYVTTPVLTGLIDGAVLKFDVVCYNDKDSKGLTLTGINCTLDVTSFLDYNNNSAGYKNYTVNISEVGEEPKIKFSTSSGTRVFLDNIIITQPATTIPVIIAASKEWVTYSSPYVLDFSEDIDNLLGAYYVSGHEAADTKLSVTKVTTKVPAKTGLLLHVTSSDESQTINIPIGTTGTALSSNMLVSVLSPTYIEPTMGDYTILGISGGNFVGFNNPGVIGANKAYLKIPTSDMPSASSNAKLQIVIDTTGISDVRGKMDDVRSDIYNLSGQKVNDSYKGIVIINGKKIIRK